MLTRQALSIRVENRGLWVEDHAHPPKVTQEIAELAHKERACDRTPA